MHFILESDLSHDLSRIFLLVNRYLIGSKILCNSNKRLGTHKKQYLVVLLSIFYRFILGLRQKIIAYIAIFINVNDY